MSDTDHSIGDVAHAAGQLHGLSGHDAEVHRVHRVERRTGVVGVGRRPLRRRRRRRPERRVALVVVEIVVVGGVHRLVAQRHSCSFFWGGNESSSAIRSSSIRFSEPTQSASRHRYRAPPVDYWDGIKVTAPEQLPDRYNAINIQQVVGDGHVMMVQPNFLITIEGLVAE